MKFKWTASNSQDVRIQICALVNANQKKLASIDVIVMYNFIPIDLALSCTVAFLVKNKLTGLEIDELLRPYFIMYQLLQKNRID